MRLTAILGIAAIAAGCAHAGTTLSNANPRASGYCRDGDDYLVVSNAAREVIDVVAKYGTGYIASVMLGSAGPGTTRIALAGTMIDRKDASFRGQADAGTTGYGLRFRRMCEPRRREGPR